MGQSAYPFIDGYNRYGDLLYHHSVEGYVARVVSRDNFFVLSLSRIWSVAEFDGRTSRLKRIAASSCLHRLQFEFLHLRS